ncbi:MAG: hypothetical protein K6T63_11720 [Alicyclobacillus herbarius]|uniref:PaaI family thioesterase n=1 Tax=Alicyclobacillus herbarius TaxID=122960 RepID=UPI002356F26B|nr:hypothetical protein [Alicyclobacillus herbarius]MCL6633285.1 hypothetical protein [Alicyclobacillus herbarius]
MGFVQFLAAAKLGQRLIAETAEKHQTYRVGFYDMTVHTEEGRPICRCLGVVQRLSRSLLDDGADAGRQPG